MVLVEEAHAAESIDKAQATEELAVLEKQLLEIDAVENATEYERMSNRVKIARTKISLVGGN
jgi:hypothetical protein